VYIIIRGGKTERRRKMAKKQGWWELKITPPRIESEPNDTDLEHIAELIKQGYTQGEIVADEEEPTKE